MTETTLPNDNRRLSGRLARTRIATRAAIIRRAGLAACPAAAPACLPSSPACRGSACSALLPEMVRLVVAGLFALGALVALYPLRGFADPDASPRSTGASRPPTGSSTIRFRCSRTGRAATTAPSPTRSGASTSGAWPSSWRRYRAICRAPACPNAIRGRCAQPRAALRRRLRLFLRPVRRLADRCLSRPQPAIDAMPPRIDAWVTPPAYTGRAPIFLTAESNAEHRRFTVPRAAR